MSGYTKLFSTILASSIWNESDCVRIVWITLLAMSDRHGIVDASVGGIAHQARKTRDETMLAIEVLMSPDPDSKNPENEGRRLEQHNGTGYRILNYTAYRDGLSDDPEAISARERQRKHRNKRDGHVTSRDTGDGAGAGADPNPKGDARGGVQEIPAKTDFDSFWEVYPSKVGKKDARKAWDKAKDRPAIEKIMAAVNRQMQSDRWRKDGGQFIPNPATWINQGRWDDEVKKERDPCDGAT